MQKIVPIDPSYPDPKILSAAATIIKAGGVVAFPTDTCYGLAVDPLNSKALRRLYKIKGRLASKPFIILISSIASLEFLIESPSPFGQKVIPAFWPGPLTIIFYKKKTEKKLATEEKETIAIRLPKAAIPIGLIHETGFPITATSANYAGQSPANSAQEIEASLGQDIDMILDGGDCASSPSTILDLSGTSPIILRSGKISSDLLRQFFDQHRIRMRPEIKLPL